MMKELYSAQQGQRWQRKVRGLKIGLWLTGALGLAACILLCSLVRTGNASLLFGLVSGISTLCGWAVMLTLYYGYFPARAQAEHFRGILEGEGQQAQGVWKMEKQRWRIPHSVAFYKVTLTEGEESHSLQINAALAGDLPRPGDYVQVKTVRKFITAYEVQHEKA